MGLGENLKKENRRLWRFAVCVIALGGCTANDQKIVAERSEVGRVAAVPTTPQIAEVTPSSVKSTAKYRVRQLLKEVSRSEVRIGGPLIDFGSADQYKYTRGDWATGWSVNTTPVSGAETSATILGKSARLNFYLWNRIEELHIRARSPKGAQRVQVSVGKRTLGDIQVGEEWTELRLPTENVGIGHQQIRFKQEEGKPVQVDWLWLSTHANSKVPVQATMRSRVGAVNLQGRLRRSLLSPSAQSHSFYLHIPEDTSLQFDYGCNTGTMDFVVRIEGVDSDKNRAQEFFRKPSTSTWQAATIDLSSFAGQLIRLELATTGTGTGGAWGEPELRTSVGAKPVTAKDSGASATNLVMIVLDTTRADMFAAFSPDNGVFTPNIDAFAAKATTFTRAYNNGNWTKPSVLSMLSGLYPATHTATKPESMVPAGIELLPEYLQKRGFLTQGFSSNPVVSKKFGFERGWDDFGLFYGTAATGEKMYKRASDWVQQQFNSESRDTLEKPFFLYIQTIDPHTTYNVPKEYWRRYYKKDYDGPIGKTFTRADQKKVNGQQISVSRDDTAWVRALYQGEVSYQDEHVGGFLETLKELGALKNTIVVITNDHGEEVFDHGSVGHGWSLYEEMIRAPLMIYYPPVFPKATVVEDIVEHVDLAPTLVEALGLAPMQGTEGVSFLTAARDQQITPQRYALSLSDNGKRSIVVGNWKLVVRETGGWRHLYKMQGPKPESDDRKNDAELAGRYCEIYMAEGMATPSKRLRLKGIRGGKQFEARDAHMDAETIKQMEALGYL